MSIEILAEQEVKLIQDWIIWVQGKHYHKERLIRNATMFLLMLDAGLRVNEVANLPKNSLMFSGDISKQITVPGTIAKNKTERQIPTSARLSKMIQMQDTWNWQPDQTPPDGYAFYSKTYTSHLANRQIHRIIKKISLKIISREIHPHILRHTFATRLMRVAKPSVVQELLGHKSLSSTQIYMHPNSNDLSTAIEAIG